MESFIPNNIVKASDSNYTISNREQFRSLTHSALYTSKSYLATDTGGYKMLCTNNERAVITLFLNCISTICGKSE